MSLVKELAGNSLVAWSPSATQPGFAVLGSKQGGGGFDDYGGTLQLASLNLTDRSTAAPVVSEIKTTYDDDDLPNTNLYPPLHS